MGRKKKNQNSSNNIEEAQEERKIKFDLAGDAKRSAAAVFLFAIASLVLLGFFGQAGMVGNYLDKAVAMSIGWSKVVFPFFLIAGGVVLLLRKETSFYVTKLFGLAITFLSLTSLFHWFSETDKMLETAAKGSGGGYLGYAIAHTLSVYAGEAGSLVILLAIFLIGVIIAFNFSIIHLAAKLLERKEKSLSDEEEATEEEVSLEVESEEKEEPVDKEDEKNNIRKIEFVEGPDRFVSASLEKDLNRDNNDSEKNGRVPKSRKSSRWVFPPLDLLEKSSGVAKGGDVNLNVEIIERTLHNFGIEVERDEIKTGPAVTQYSFRPAVGVKISKILSLQNDLSLALAAHPIRIEAPIPGKSLIGIEVPNKVSAMVRLRDILEQKEFKARNSNLTLALGKDVSGSSEYSPLDKMPHLLIAGATGTGKSVGINSLITTLLYQNSPDELKLIMVDPKRVELSLYNGIPHLLTDVIVENSKVVNALKWAVGEMERRYRILQDVGSRDLRSYREKLASGVKRKYTDPETNETHEEDMEKLPYIVIIIDELADLMGSHGKEVEGTIVRIAQMARAVGIHLILSTQRPSVEVITGLIKANITTRIAFQVATQIDSRTILDMAGAEKLLGNGDLLFLSAASPKPKRIQGVYVSESEVKRVVKFIKEQKKDEEEKVEMFSDTKNEGVNQSSILEFKENAEAGSDDELVLAAKEEVTRAGKASASLLQRRLRVGYARAARLLDILEEQGIVGPADGAKPREVYTKAAKDDITYDDPADDQGKRDKWEI